MVILCSALEPGPSTIHLRSDHAATSPSTAYSTICAALRTSQDSASAIAAHVSLPSNPGNRDANHCQRWASVLSSAPNSPEESTMNPNHTTSSRPRRRTPANDGPSRRAASEIMTWSRLTSEGSPFSHRANQAYPKSLRVCTAARLGTRHPGPRHPKARPRTAQASPVHRPEPSLRSRRDCPSRTKSRIPMLNAWNTFYYRP